MKRLFQFILGILFLPACFVQSYVFYQSLRVLQKVEGDELYFFYGSFIYFLIHTLIAKPVFLYTVAHESVHAAFSTAFGGKVKSVKVSGKEGETKTTKSNLLVELAPYFTPLYALLLCLGMFIVVRLFEATAWRDLFFLLIGFSLTFHVVMTVDFLKTKQTDLLRLGNFFSVEMIYLVNLLVIVFVLGFVFPEVSPRDYFVNALIATEAAYQKIFHQLFL